jgi:superfamily II helicase
MRASGTIDLGFLAHISELVVCSRCFKRGVRTPIRQVISARHRPRTLCRPCAERPLRS